MCLKCIDIKNMDRNNFISNDDFEKYSKQDFSEYSDYTEEEWLNYLESVDYENVIDKFDEDYEKMTEKNWYIYFLYLYYLSSVNSLDYSEVLSKFKNYTIGKWQMFLTDLDYKRATKSFSALRKNMTKEDYKKHTQEIKTAIAQGKSLDRKVGETCDVHINCGCHIIRNEFGNPEWKTTGRDNVCDYCLTLQKNFNNKYKIINKMEKIYNSSEYIYCLDAYAEEPIILINDAIGVDCYGNGIDGKQVQREILSLAAEGKKKIKVYITSIGGSVIDAQMIFDAILRCNTQVDTYCIGLAASSAGLIFLAGQNRYIVDYGTIMTHNPWMESEDEEGEENKFLKITRESIIKMLSERSGLSAKKISDFMNDETWMDCDEAVKSGFATEIIKTSDYNVERVRDKINIEDRLRECSLIMNKVFKLDKKNNNKMELNKINAKLGLNDDATVENTISEITKLKNSIKVAEDSKTDLTKEVEQLKAQLETAKNEVEDLKNSIAEAEAKNKEEKAKEMILNFVKQGKIKNEATAIEKWETLALHDFEIAKSLIEDLPVNKSSMTFTTSGSPSNKNEENSIAKAMLEIRNKINNK